MAEKIAYRIVVASYGHTSLTTCECVVAAPTEANAIVRAKTWAAEKFGVPADKWGVSKFERMGLLA